VEVPSNVAICTTYSPVTAINNENNTQNLKS